MSLDLAHFVAALQQAAPLALAEDWDNVGLLISPSRPRGITRALLTIDLTAAVLQEAETRQVQAIVAYHPPIFSGLKRIHPDERVGHLVLRAVEQGLAVYSPHTALDAVEGGVNDWLAEAFDAVETRALVPRALQPNGASSTKVGQGRMLQLRQPLSAEQAHSLLKQHLRLTHLRYAAPREPRPINSVALCAGAGGSVIQHSGADLLLTGEMRHHDVLHATETGQHVILTEHTHSERGYLPRLAQRLHALCGHDVEWLLAVNDRDPLAVV
jgi:dinuclear metal center YbgI/SA1388 family protein